MKESFVLYNSFYEPIKGLKDSEKANLFDAIFIYQIEGRIIEMSPMCQMAFCFMKSQFERDNEKYNAVLERNKANGAKGGRPAKNPKEPKKPTGLNGNPKNPLEPKKPDNDNVNDNVNVSDSGKEKEKPDSFPPKDKIDFNIFLDTFHTYCPELPNVKALTKARKATIEARNKEHGKKVMFEVIKKTGASRFLNGENDRGFKASFDWIFNPTNFVKILEGNYDNQEAKKEKPTYKPLKNQLDENLLGQSPDYKRYIQNIQEQAEKKKLQPTN